MLLFAGFLFTVIIYVVIGRAAGFLGIIADRWSLLIFISSLAFILISSKSAGLLGRYIISSFKKNYEYSKNELECLSAAVRSIIKFILATGGFTFIAFLIISLGHIGAPEKLGVSLGICLSSLTYAVAISFFIFFPVQAWAENKIARDFPTPSARTEFPGL